MITKKKLTIAAALISVIVLATPAALAQTATPNIRVVKSAPSSFLDEIGIKDGSLIPLECISDDEPGTPCNLNSVFQTIVNITQLILAMTGSLALLMFIYGGAMFILAAGAQERIQKAKQVLVTASVGVAIVFSAWLIVNIVIGAVTNGEIHSPATIFNNFWFNQPSG